MVLLKIGIDNLPSDTNFDEFALGKYISAARQD